MRRSAPGGGPVLQELAPAGHLNATSILIDGLPADPEALAGGSDKGDKKGRRPPGRSPPGRLGRRLRIAAGAAALTMMALVLLAGQRAPVPSPLMAGGGLPAEALHQAAATAASLGRAGAQAGLWGPQPVQQGEPAGLFQRPQGAASQQAAAVPLLPQQQLQEQGLPQHATAEGAAQWKPQQQAAQLPWHSAERAAGAKAAPGPVLVEFTVPGLHIPLREAADVSLPERPEEAALAQLLPGDSARAAAAASKRPSLAQVLAHYQQLQGKASSSSTTTTGGGAATGGATVAVVDETEEGAAAAGGAGGGAGGGAAGSLQSEGAAHHPGEGIPQRSSADLANEIQHSIQQAEEAAARERREAQEALARLSSGGEEKSGGGGKAGEDASYEEMAAKLLRRPLEAQPAPQPTNSRQGSGRVLPQAGDSAAAADVAWGARSVLPLAGQGAGAAAGASSVRMLVGVVSACCTESAAQRRAVIRETWARAVQEHPGTELRFFLAQPPDAAALVAWLPSIQEEVERHGDVVVLRGADTYRNLPNKTMRLLRYVAADPGGFTHVLKTDDDCYVRIGKVLKALSDPVDAVAPVGAVAGMAQPHRAARAAPRRRLPATQAQLEEMMGRDGRPLHTDGIQLYNTTHLVAAAGRTAGTRYLDDAEGEPVSLAAMSQAAQAAAKRHQLQLAQLHGGAAAGQGQQLPHGQQQVGAQLGAGAATSGGGGALAAGPGAQRAPRMAGVYMGCMENRGGFFPIRDPASKWYVPPSELPDSAVPFAVKYLAGWGVVLSRDMAQHAVAKANLFQAHPELAPAWFGRLNWEDVMLGMLLEDATEPQDHPGFRAAWRACPASSALKHLDVDAPRLFKGLHEQDVSGLWDQKPVQCASGDYLPGDYSGWKRWRDALPTVEHI